MVKGRTRICRLRNLEKLKDSRWFRQLKKGPWKTPRVKAAEGFTTASESRNPTEPMTVFKTVGEALTFNAIGMVGNGSVHFLKSS